MRLLLPLLFVPAIWAQTELFPFGTDKGDQIIANDGWYAATVDIPIVYMETPQSDVFISNNGIVSFGEQLSDASTYLKELGKSAIAVFYAPTSQGTTYFRATSSDRRLLNTISEMTRKEFTEDKDFSAKQAVIVTWVNMMNTEGQAGNTFQLILASDGMKSYAMMQYKDLRWARSGGMLAQSGFAHIDGRHQYSINSGTESIKDLVNLSNNDRQGNFLFRISGSSLEDPREGEEDDYVYNDYETDYEGDAKSKNQPQPPQAVEVDEAEEEEPSRPEPNDDNTLREYHPLDPRRNQFQKKEEAHQHHAHGQDGHPVHHVHVDPEAPQHPNSVGEEIEIPANSVEPKVQACDVGHSCHVNARCEDHPPGHCCVCQPGFYGNGKECQKKGEPQRISGGFEGVINGERIEKTDLHTFITGSDGNAYTALSKIPAHLGTSMMLLNPIGSVMGWLFAEVDSHLVYNGFQLTGGLFNRTATVHIGDTSVVTIRQHFAGRDIYDYFKANVFVSGTLPKLQEDAQVAISDYDEDYRREGPGFVRSYSNMDVTVTENGEKRKMRMTVDQQVHYTECSFKKFGKAESVTLNVKRIHVTFDKEEGIVRYASRNYADTHRTTQANPREQGRTDQTQHRQNPLNPIVDVCAEGRHVCTLPNMKCRPADNSYRCECLHGFQAKHDSTAQIGWRCVDLNECERGDHTCDPHATCTNSEGSFTCECNPGFNGNGFTCISAAVSQESDRQHSAHHIAHSHDRHSEHQAASPPQPAKGSCTAHSQCHQWGECVFTPGNPTGYCKCRGWYTGDGVEHCGPPQEVQAPESAHHSAQHHNEQRTHHNSHIPPKGGQPCGHSVCDINAECMPSTDGGSECVCKAGFIGNGLQCESLVDESDDEQRNVQEGSIGTVCRAHDECSEHGSCAYNPTVGYYQCQCTEPYHGDGIRCELSGQRSEEIHIPSNVEELGCDRLRNCHQDAQCVYDSFNRKYKCECNSGFLGDGLNCVRTSGGGDANWEGHSASSHRCREQTDCHQSAHCVQNSNNEYFCECLPGYRGDGLNECRMADQCSPADSSSCAQNAECVYGEREGGYVCKCIQGFVGDGVQCRAHAPRTTCDRDPRICHANAQCVYNHEIMEYGCLCKPGSQGDGQHRCDPVETPQCTNCSSHAHCVQSSTGGWKCQCSIGYVGSGYVCAPLTSCLDDRSICDSHAECVPGERGHYVCNCHYGYHGNGRTCTPDSEARGNTLLIARGMAIFQRGTHQDLPGKQLIVIPHHIAVGVDFDCQEERIIWSDISGHSLRSAALNGSDSKSYFTENLQSPEGIAVDWSSRNVYYADSLKDEIGVASMDGKYQKAIVTEGLVNPRALAIDMMSKHVYYTDWHRENPMIGRVNADGTNNDRFVNEDIHLPNGLTILHNRKELCWVDAGSHKLSCIGLDGRNRRVVYSNLNYPFGLTHVNEERFYWTDWKDNRIHSIGVYGDAYASMPISLGGSGKVYGITAVPDKCSGAASACSLNNGGCKYLCLPADDGVKCVCPDNVENLPGC